MNPNTDSAAISALFDISELPIQEWIAANAENKESQFGNETLILREMQIFSPETSSKYKIGLVCCDKKEIDYKQRLNEIKILRSFSTEFGKILNLYMSSIAMTYTSTIAARDFICSDNVYKKLKEAKFDFDIEHFIWNAIFSDGSQSSHVLLLRATEVDEPAPFTGKEEFIENIDSLVVDSEED
jgi:hypothetical protein